MALIKCSECGNDVSETAVCCPKCGNTVGFNKVPVSGGKPTEGNLRSKKDYETNVFRNEHKGLAFVDGAFGVIGVFVLLGLIGILLFTGVVSIGCALYIIIWFIIELVYYTSLNSAYSDYLRINGK